MWCAQLGLADKKWQFGHPKRCGKKLEWAQLMLDQDIPPASFLPLAQPIIAWPQGQHVVCPKF